MSPANDEHSPAPEPTSSEDGPVVDWRRNAQAEILFAGPTVATAASIAGCIEQVLGAEAQVTALSPGDEAWPAGVPVEQSVVNVDYRGVALAVTARAEAVDLSGVPEGTDYAGEIRFPQDNPSFAGPLDAARGLVVWQNRASELLRTSSRVHIAGAVYGPDENSGTPPGVDLPLDALREEIAVATIAAVLTTLDDGGLEPIGVWVPLAGLCIPAPVYRETVVNAPLPTPVLVGLRVGVFLDDPSAPVDPENPPLTFAFTTGMFRFGRADLEFPRRSETPPQTMGTALDVITFELGTNSSFLPGEKVDLRDGRVFTVTGARSRITGWSVLHIEDAVD